MSYQRIRLNNALARAEQMEQAGTRADALQLLHDILTQTFSSKRTRQWSQDLESILLEYLALCVEYRRGRQAKDLLHQFKGVSQVMYLHSLETVIRHFLRLAQDKAAAAVAEARDLGDGTLDLDGDLDEEEVDVMATGDEAVLMLRHASGDTTEERNVKAVVTPWLKFLWETYRTILDILRNNSKMETLYHETAHQAVAFCTEYERKLEFRRLCDMLRNHLRNLGAYGHAINTIDIHSGDSLMMNMRTRFIQVDAAIELRMWQEAFHALEDVHGLIVVSRVPITPTAMAKYYSKLSQVFYMGHQYLFHAYARFKLYSITKTQNKNLTPEEDTRLATNVFLAALCIPIEAEDADGKSLLESFDPRDKKVQLAMLFGSPMYPSRSEQLSKIIARGVVNQVDERIRPLYNVLERDFQPLKLMGRLQAILDIAADDQEYSVYANQLQRVAFVRLVQQLSRVYKTFRLDRLCTLAAAFDRQTVEKLVCEAVKDGIVAARINHQTQMLSFATQVMESERVRTHMSTLARKLESAVKTITRDAAAHDRAKARAQIHSLVRQKDNEANQRLLARRSVIEKRRELEEMVKARDDEAAARAAREAKERRDREEREKLEAETKAHNDARLAREAAEREREMTERQAKELEEQGFDVSQIEGEVNRQKLLELQVTELEKEKRERSTRLSSYYMRLDHVERLARERERPLLEAYVEEEKERNRQFYETMMENFREEHRSKHARALGDRNRMMRFADDKEAFATQILERRKAIFDRNFEQAKRQLIEQRREEAARAAEEERVRREKEEARLVAEAEMQERKRTEEAIIARRIQEKALEEKYRDQGFEILEARERARADMAADGDAPPSGGDGGSGGGRDRPWMRSGGGGGGGGDSAPRGDDSSGESRPWRRNAAPRDDAPSSDNGSRNDGGESRPWRRDAAPRDDAPRDSAPRDAPSDNDRPWRRTGGGGSGGGSDNGSRNDGGESRPWRRDGGGGGGGDRGSDNGSRNTGGESRPWRRDGGGGNSNNSNNSNNNSNNDGGRNDDRNSNNDDDGWSTVGRRRR